MYDPVLGPEPDQLRQAGQEMYGVMTRLFPLCRSITGQGVRDTLAILRETIPVEIREVPSGTQVLDWRVPPEWNIREAWIKDPSGRKIVDFARHNLHVVSYSAPVHAILSRAELDEHLHSLPDQPDAIPYLTSYYNRNWGFSLAHQQRETLAEGAYEVLIDSTLDTQGSLTCGELFLPGQRKEEVLISCYLCHPSMCNDSLSGVVLAAILAKWLAARERSYSYRFLFVPETIGAITWLARNEASTANIRHGLVATCCGDAGSPTYKKSRRGNADIDRAAGHVLAHSGKPYKEIDFFPNGSDERQYCSPGFDLPVGSLMRTMYGHFPAYHTSLDDLDFVAAEHLADTLRLYLGIIDVLEGNRRFRNLNPKGEPQLGRRGLYGAIGGRKAPNFDENALFWMLNLSDGQNTLLDIALRAKMPFSKILYAANLLLEAGLIEDLGLAVPDR